MTFFKDQNLLEFAERFKTDQQCKAYLAEIKWKSGYSCRKCGNESYQIRKNLSRTCNKCSDTESPTANTIFHRVRFGTRIAFFICFEMTTSAKSLSPTQMGVRYGITEKTARLFMRKVKEAIRFSKCKQTNGPVQMTQFILDDFKQKTIDSRVYIAKKRKADTTFEFLTIAAKQKRKTLKTKGLPTRPLHNLHP